MLCNSESVRSGHLNVMKDIVYVFQRFLILASATEVSCAVFPESDMNQK